MAAVRGKRWRGVWAKVHLWLSLVLAVPILLSSLTGAVLVWHGPLDRLLHPSLLTVEPDGRRLPAQRLQDIAAAHVRSQTPDAAVGLVTLPRAPTDPFMVLLRKRTGGWGEAVYVNPYTGAVLGRRGDGFLDVLHDLHKDLLLGQAGKAVLAIGAVGLAILALTGLYLWWPRRDVLRRLFRVRLSGSAHKTHVDLHNVFGFWSSLFSLLAALTGLLLLYESLFHPLVARMMPTSAPVALDRPVSDPAAGPGTLSLAAVLDAARERFPDGEVGWVTLPATPDGVFRVKMTRPGELYPSGRTYLYLDRYSGRILWENDALLAPPGQVLLYHLPHPLHDGRLGGGLHQGAMVLAGVAPLVLMVTGLSMWQTTRRARRKAAARKASVRT